MKELSVVDRKPTALERTAYHEAGHAVMRVFQDADAGLILGIAGL